MNENDRPQSTTPGSFPRKGLIVLDVDNRPDQGKDGFASLRELEREHGPLPLTPRVLSGGGGVHYWFAGTGERVSSGPLRGYPGLDLKGDRGYVLAPPSVHPSGRRYEWDVDAHIDDVPLATVPGFLIALRGKPAEQNEVAYPAKPWRGELPDVIERCSAAEPSVRLLLSKGHRSLGYASPSEADWALACMLLDAGVDPAAVEHALRWRHARVDRRTKSPGYFARTVRKVLARREEVER